MFSTLEGTFHCYDQNEHTHHQISDEDGLDYDWDGYSIFLNPPYGRGIASWMKKAAESDALVVALIPVRTGSKWWYEWVEPYADIEFLHGRLKFVGAKWAAPFDSAIARYR
jgi:site-specific DNA-methyltransferase (adenine-specific)